MTPKAPCTGNSQSLKATSTSMKGSSNWPEALFKMRQPPSSRPERYITALGGRISLTATWLTLQSMRQTFQKASIPSSIGSEIAEPSRFSSPPSADLSGYRQVHGRFSDFCWRTRNLFLGRVLSTHILDSHRHIRGPNCDL